MNNLKSYSEDELVLVVANTEPLYVAVNEMFKNGEPIIDVLKVLSRQLDFTLKQAEVFADYYNNWNK